MNLFPVRFLEHLSNPPFFALQKKRGHLLSEAALSRMNCPTYHSKSRVWVWVEICSYSHQLGSNLAKKKIEAAHNCSTDSSTMSGVVPKWNLGCPRVMNPLNGYVGGAQFQDSNPMFESRNVVKHHRKDGGKAKFPIGDRQSTYRNGCRMSSINTIVIWFFYSHHRNNNITQQCENSKTRHDHDQI